jgi:hypothetical protein
MENERISDAEYLRSIAKGYANSFVGEWHDHHTRLLQIAKKVEAIDADMAAIAKELLERGSK